MTDQARSGIKAMLFDVFGTCVDWRSGVIRDGERLGGRQGLAGIDWARFADAWRARYHPQMEPIRSGARPWVTLDVLHRENLEAVLAEFGIAALAPEARDAFNRIWHRLDPWPDTVPGLTRLKRGYIIAPNSNGHIALMVNLARYGGLPWDAILGAEITRAYKPMPEAYLRSAAALNLRPDQVMMVAAHNYDLAAAQAVGLRTAFVPRQQEHGPGQTTNLAPEGDYDVVARDMVDLAVQMGCDE